jgi:hypothetical protein
MRNLHTTVLREMIGISKELLLISMRSRRVCIVEARRLLIPDIGFAIKRSVSISYNQHAHNLSLSLRKISVLGLDQFFSNFLALRFISLARDLLLLVISGFPTH